MLTRRQLPAQLTTHPRMSLCAGVVYTMQRPSGGTNQRMAFDVEPCGRHLATGERRLSCAVCFAVTLVCSFRGALARRSAVLCQSMPAAPLRRPQSVGMHPLALPNLSAGGEDGVVRLFDLRDGSEAGQFAAAEDTGALHVHVHAPGHACMKDAQPREF